MPAQHSYCSLGCCCGSFCIKINTIKQRSLWSPIFDRPKLCHTCKLLGQGFFQTYSLVPCHLPFRTRGCSLINTISSGNSGVHHWPQRHLYAFHFLPALKLQFIAQERHTLFNPLQRCFCLTKTQNEHIVTQLAMLIHFTSS